TTATAPPTIYPLSLHDALPISPVSFSTPAAANAAGIACIFQELSLIPDLSVADNIAISNPPLRFGLIDRPAQRRMAEAALERARSEEHTSELQSLRHLVCRLLL